MMFTNTKCFILPDTLLFKFYMYSNNTARKQNYFK